MDRDWPRTIRARNIRELVAVGILAAVVGGTRGVTLETAPLFVALSWVAWFFARYARWQAAPAEGGVGVRRELIRQGHLLMSAWAWYVLPLIVAASSRAGSRRTPGPVRSSSGAGVVLAAVNYRAGKQLVDAGNA